MAEIMLNHISHRYGEGDQALRNVDLVWENGGAYALLGPSGCGKSTMLDIISGLLAPSEGEVLFDGVDVSGMSPAERNIAQVFQFPVLYESMTVEQNLRFPLRNRGIGKTEAQKRAEEISELLEIGGLRRHRAKGLSADAKQLVSLGRALVRRDVSAILFDEPLTAIDPQKKWGIRQALKRVHQELNHTLVYVTHDQTEALTFADEVVVMSAGEVVQKATPDVLFERPAHRFVGNFIGSPGMNFLPATVNGSRVAVGGVDLLDAPECPGVTDADASASDDLVVGIRPEFVRCHGANGSGRIRAAIGRRQDLGTTFQFDLSVDGTRVIAKLPARPDISGVQCWVDFDPGHLMLFYKDQAVEGVTSLRVPADANSSRGEPSS